jgi:hypothetical protein
MACEGDNQSDSVHRTPRWTGPTFMPVIILCLGAVLLLPCLGFAPVAVFPEELIDLSVHEKDIEVRATYVYKNPWPFPIEQGFCVPLPVDSKHPMPEPVTLTQVKTAEPVPIRNWFGRRTFELTFGPQETVPVQLYYKQDAPNRTATYILTSTRAWMRPLRQAVYKLHCDESLSIASNYPMECCGKTNWSWRRTNFMPDRDWQVSWSN